MSSGESLADLTQSLQLSTTLYCIDVAVLVVTLYDWLLTFPDEIRIMWKRPVTGAKVLFLLNRYSFIAATLVEILSDFGWGFSNASCSSIESANCAFGVFNNLVVSVFQTARVYAVTGGMWQFALPVGALYDFPVFVSIFVWVKSTFSAVSPPLQGCGQSLDMSGTTFVRLNIAQRVCVVVADAITIVVTIHHIYGTVKAAKETKIHTKLSSALLRAGLLYFGVMLLVNLADLVVTSTTVDDYVYYIAALFNYLLISHILLNLQDLSRGESNDPASLRPSFVLSGQGQESSILFANNIIGNLGAPLRDGFHGDEDDEDTSDIATADRIEVDSLPPEENPVTMHYRDLPIWRENITVHRRHSIMMVDISEVSRLDRIPTVA